MQLFSWLHKRMTGRPQTRSTPAHKPAPRFRPQLETLEARDVPSFAAPVTSSVSQPVALVTADVNGDRKPDLLTLAGGGTYVSVQLNNGKGGFGTAQTFFDPGQTATAMAVGDVNGDGKPDLVLANTYNGDPVVSGTYTGSVTVLLGNGKGGFSSPTGPEPQVIFPEPVTSLALADVYGNGKMAIVATTARAGTVYVAGADAFGLFGRAQSYPVPGNLSSPVVPAQVAVGDFNGDGRPDIVVTDPALNSVSVLLNNGNGTFGTAQTYAVGASPTAVAVGDVSGDGKLDVVTANASGTVSVLRGNAGGTFGAAQTYAIGGAPKSIALGDFNKDGKLDIVTTGSEMDVLLNNGDGTFGTAQKVGPGGSSVAVADFNGDGFLDLAQIDGSGTAIDVLLNDAVWTTGGQKGHK
jgi:hypothetical protein